MPKRCTSEEDYRRALAESGKTPLFLYKHSST
jgi:hypothetical protein